VAHPLFPPLLYHADGSIGLRLELLAAVAELAVAPQ
jgi:hypothetical protein